MLRDNRGSALTGVIAALVVLLILAIVGGSLIRFDVMGVGQILAPSLKDVPVVNMILPEIPGEAPMVDDGYNFETVEEAVEILKLTEKMLTEKDEEADTLNEQLTQLTAEVERLKVFETNQLQFEADKAQFDNLVATTPDAIVYSDWFEKMNPENAAEIYAEVAGEVAVSEELKGTISIYQSMKPDEAAAILEEMSVTKLDQVATIIRELSSEQAADVLGSMEPTTAGKITTYIFPE